MVKIKKILLPERCEICHQSDCFEPARNYCWRCQELVSDEMTISNCNSRRLCYVDRWMIAGALLGLTFGLIQELHDGISLRSLSFFSLITGLMLIGLIFGSIVGGGIEKLRNKARV